MFRLNHSRQLTKEVESIIHHTSTSYIELRLMLGDATGISGPRGYIATTKSVVLDVERQFISIFRDVRKI